MTKPDVQQVEKAAATPAFSVCGLKTLTKRADFLKAAKAKRQHVTGFVLQCRKRKTTEAPSDLIRVGFTCSKKVGNAVIRNRAKRRLREVARLTLPDHGRPGFDYVLIGRADATISRTFEDLKGDLITALKVLHP